MSVLLENMLKSGQLKPRGVVHAGAEWCQEAPLYHQAGAEFVLWFEASHENLSTALGELRKFPNQRLIANAVWENDGETLDFHIYNARSSNSLFSNDQMQKWYPRHTPERIERVTTITLDTAIDRFWQTGVPIELLVMDLQGAEINALRGASKLLASRELKYICTEAMVEPLYKGGTQLAQLDELLLPLGFQRAGASRHDVSIWYPEIKEQIERGELAPIPQFDVLYQRLP